MTRIYVILKWILVKQKEGDWMPLINHLKEYRARFHLSQTDLGNLVGVSRQTISLIERGDYNPSVTLALKIAKVLESTVEELFSYFEDEK